MAPPSMPARSLSSTIASYEKQLDQQLAKYPSMLKLERKLGVPKARIVAGAGLALAAYALLHLATTMLIALVIFAYPAFMTMRAMESGSKSEHSLWLAYWVSAAALQLGEAFTMGALSHVIPFYTILKLALHMWLYLPATQGALTVYESALRPTFKNLVGNPQFAAAADKFGSMANKIATDGTKLAAEAKKAGEEALKKAASEASTTDPRIAASASLSKDD